MPSVMEVRKEKTSSEDRDSNSLPPNSSQNLESVSRYASMVFFLNSLCGIPGKD